MDTSSLIIRALFPSSRRLPKCGCFARALGKVGGWPLSLIRKIAKALLADPAITTRKIAERLGVSVSTLYKHIPSARAIVTRGEPTE